MAYQHWQLRGRTERTEFIRLRDAYHGDTIGSVSVGGIDLFHERFRSLLFPTHEAEPGDAAGMRRLLEAHGERVAAVIMEPLVQGAAGMIVHPEGYLRAVRDLCDEFGVLLICDEVAVGFGRTGTMFACQQEDVAPDLMCVAKGITGGYLPLAATLTTEEIYESFLGEHAELKTFFHGHTYTGNPLACAAALATLDVFEEERTLERLRRRSRCWASCSTSSSRRCPRWPRSAAAGFMTGIELIAFPLDARMGHRVTLAARRRGAIVRPLGDTIVLMPPLAITEDELVSLVGITAGAIEEATGAGLRARGVIDDDELEDDEDTGPIRLWPALVALGVDGRARGDRRRRRALEQRGGRARRRAGADDADRAGGARRAAGAVRLVTVDGRLRAADARHRGPARGRGGLHRLRAGARRRLHRRGRQARCREVVLPQAVGPRRVVPEPVAGYRDRGRGAGRRRPVPADVRRVPRPRRARSRPCGRRRRGSTSRTGCRRTRSRAGCPRRGRPRRGRR